jgi:hypothetical protein
MMSESRSRQERCTMPKTTTPPDPGKQRRCVVCGKGMLRQPGGEAVPPAQRARIALEGRSYSVHSFCIGGFIIDPAAEAQRRIYEEDVWTPSA